MNPSRRDRVLGCLMGGAIGDTLGGIAERGRPCLSDDTQFTLATGEAIVRANGVDPSTIASTFVTWFRERRFIGLGSSTLKALRDLEAGAHWALAGAKGERAAGNGAAMRAAPLAFFLDPNDAGDRQALRDACRITHQNDEACAGALAVVCAIRLALEGRAPAPGEWLTSVAGMLPDCLTRDRLAEVGAAAGTLSIPEAEARFGSSGHVVETVPLAVLGAEQMMRHGFKEPLAQLVAASADADTIASIAGQIAGAGLGLSAIPQEMVLAVPDAEAILEIANALASVAGA